MSKSNLNIRIESATHREAKGFAAMLGISLGALTEAALRDYMGRHGNPKFAPVATNVDATDVAKEKEGKGEGKERKSPTPPLREKGKEEREEKERRKKETNARAKDDVFVAPELDDVKAYAKERGYADDDAEAFFDFYTACGWLIGSKPMRHWRAALRAWMRSKPRFEVRKRGEGVVGGKRRDAASPSHERKKPSWMTWEQWQFEEQERRNNARLREKVERVNKGLDKVRKEFGL